MPRNSRGRETDGDPHPPDRRLLRLIGSSSDSLLERDGFEATVPCARRLFRWTEYRAEATRSGLETMIVSRGTDSSNPAPSSGESGANLSLAGIRLSRSRSRGFPRLSGPGRAAWVGRDTRAREYLAERR